MVIDLQSEQVVMAHNSDLPLVPASTQKILTIATALLELGPEFAFKTTLATDGKDIYVFGDGDPGFGDARLAGNRSANVHDEFVRWSQLLRSAGFAGGASDIILDESIFDGERLHPTWEASDLGKWYAAPVGALNFNDNCVDITVRPAARAGAPARLQLVPDVSVINVINQCRTGDTPPPTLHHPPGTSDYILKGGCTKKWPLPSAAFPDPGLLFAEAMRATFRRTGIVCDGRLLRKRPHVADGSLPADLTVIAVYETPLLDVTRRAGKNSQNLFAECLLKRAGYARMTRLGNVKAIGSWLSGATAANAMFRRARIDRHGLIVSDGSGLSRVNRITARQLTGLLAWCQRTPLGPYLHDSLAQAGVDGSLRTRMNGTGGRVFAKTGTMRGICALAGYVDSRSSPRFAFAVLFNGYQGPSTPYRAIQDRFCSILVEASGG